jgi:DNA repair exonuclease SbcCD nuclease subunit
VLELGVVSYPYGIISDVHLHNWSQFSHINEHGINNRLQHILDGIELAANEVLKRGGTDLIITGDLLHTRGVVKPSVFNPAFDLFTNLSRKGLVVHAIPGNHDLEGKHSDRIGNAMVGFSAIPNFNVYDSPTYLESGHYFIPWMDSPKEVLNLASKKVLEHPNLTVFCHVGLNGVIPANLGETLDPKDFLKQDFKYVFSGHFHQFTNFDDRVFSVGALCHYSWADVGSLAGFLLVSETEVEQFETNAPRFVDVDSGFNESESLGNYVRVKGIELADVDAQNYVRIIREKGALGVVDQSTRPSIVEKRFDKFVDVDYGLETALSGYCTMTFGDKAKEVLTECLKLRD